MQTPGRRKDREVLHLQHGALMIRLDWNKLNNTDRVSILKRCGFGDKLSLAGKKWEDLQLFQQEAIKAKLEKHGQVALSNSPKATKEYIIERLGA
jgi:hypothetical protein